MTKTASSVAGGSSLGELVGSETGEHESSGPPMLQGMPSSSTPHCCVQLQPWHPLTTWLVAPLKYQSFSALPMLIPFTVNWKYEFWPVRQWTRQVGLYTPLPGGSDAMRSR